MILTIGAYYNKVPGSIGIGLDRGPVTDEIMDMRALRYATGSVDAVYSFDALEHVPMADQAAAIGEMYRVLRPGGYVEIGTVDFEGLCREYLAADRATRRVLWSHFYGGQSFPGDFHQSAHEEWSLRELLETAGFVEVKRIQASRPWCGGLSMEGKKPLHVTDVTA